MDQSNPIPKNYTITGLIEYIDKLIKARLQNDSQPDYCVIMYEVVEAVVKNDIPGIAGNAAISSLSLIHKDGLNDYLKQLSNKGLYPSSEIFLPLIKNYLLYTSKCRLH
jgi:hypothetical protein